VNIKVIVNGTKHNQALGVNYATGNSSLKEWIPAEKRI